MSVNFPNSSKIACICEGGTETEIMRILLDENRLKFERSQLIEEDLIRRVSVREFEKRYLSFEYEDKITILRILDSRRENFKLKELYKGKVKSIINVITSPEIEILVIIKENKLADFQKNKNMKPSVYCKDILQLKQVKNPKFIRDYFSDANDLINCIKLYQKQIHCFKNEVSLFDLIR